MATETAYFVVYDDGRRPTRCDRIETAKMLADEWRAVTGRRGCAWIEWRKTTTRRVYTV